MDQAQDNGSGDLDRIAAVVLAGGRGLRMGRDKTGIELGGKPLIEMAAEAAEAVFRRVFVSGPAGLERFGRPVIPDDHPEIGPFAGILSALEHTGAEWVFVVPCDSPFVPEAFFRGMAEMAVDCDAVVPRPGEHWEPIHALYAASCAPIIEEMIHHGEHKIINLYPQIEVREVGRDLVEKWDPQGMAFFNVNTPEDLETAKRSLEEWKVKGGF